MKNKVPSLIAEGILFCGSGILLLSYSLMSYAKSFNKAWSQSPYLFPALVGAALVGLSVWIMGQGVLAMKRAAAESAAVQNGAAQNSESQSAGTQGGAAQNTGDQNAAAAKMAGSTKSRGKLLSILVVLVLCCLYYLVLAEVSIPRVTIGILSLSITISIFEVATVVFLIAMMAFMGVRKVPVLVLVPLGTSLFLSIAFRTFLHVMLP